MSDEELVRRLRTLVDTEDMHPLSIFAETICNAADYIEHCHASHDAMAEEIERLTRELDEAFRLRYCAEDDAEIVKEQYDALLKNSAVKIDAAERKVEKLREALVGLNAAIDAFWNDSSRPAIHTFSARGIEEWQVRSCAALTETEKGDE